MVGNNSDIARTDDEIEDVIQRCADAERDGTTFRGLTYEDGVRAAIDWLLGNTTDSPFDDAGDEPSGPRRFRDVDDD